ncbi:hypothetical protein ACFW04_010366 [Cataglyphis niger]
MTAKRGRAPVVTARVIAEWRFAYRKSEYNIGVLSVSVLSRAFEVTGVSGDHLLYIEIDELSETNETPVYATPALRQG